MPGRSDPWTRKVTRDAERRVGSLKNVSRQPSSSCEVSIGRAFTTRYICANISVHMAAMLTMQRTPAMFGVLVIGLLAGVFSTIVAAAADVTVVRRREPEGSDGRAGEAIRGCTRQQGHGLVRRQQRAGQADRGRRARGPFHLGRSRLDGLSRSAQAAHARHPRQSAAQYARPHRAGVQQVRAQDRAGLRARRRARAGQARHGQPRQRAGGQIRQGRAGESRRLGERRETSRARRERARRAGARVARRSAFRHRLCDGRVLGQGREDRRHVPAEQLSAHRLSRRADWPPANRRPPSRC